MIDIESGKLRSHIAKALSKKAGNTKIANLFEEIVDMRNHIIHSFQVTAENGDQTLATKVRRAHEQFSIAKEYLLEFITKNKMLSDLLHSFRGY